MTAIDVARSYIDRGWAPVPIPFKAKGPTIDGWQKLSINKDDVDKYFNGEDQNVGVILGAASGGLADVDLDCEEAIILAPKLLPTTSAIFGRQSKPKSHYLYKVTDPDQKAAHRLQDVDDGTIIELRLGGKGGAQTVFPGSVHASGEKIEWVESGDVATVSCAELKRAIVEVGVGTLLLRVWPRKSRHEACLRLGGFFARVGWETDKIDSFVSLILSETNSNIANGRSAALDAAENYNREGKGYGLPSLIEFFGEKVTARIAKFLDYKDTANEDSLEKFNTRFCILPVGGKAKVLEFKKAEDRSVPVFYSSGDFRLLQDNQKIKVVTRDEEGNLINKSAGIGSWWLNHPKRRQYEGLVFKPGVQVTVDGYLNLWQGWGIKPKPGSWVLLRSHIKEILASGNEEFDSYILKWTAWAFQNPGAPAEVVLVLRGERGAGKGLFAREVKKAFGQHGVQISSASHLAGRFNSHLMDCSLLFADEAFWPGDKASEGALKRMITEDRLFIERKGMDGFEVDNNLHIIMSSNTDWVVPAGIHERRFAVFDVAEKQTQKKEYFTPLYAEIKAGGTAAMMHDLIALDLEGWHPRYDIPKSEALRDQQTQTLGPADQWWADMLHDGFLPGTKEDNPRLAPSAALYEKARETVPGLRFMSDHLLGRILRKHGANRDNDYRIDGRRAWLFPPLSEARAAWSRKLHTDWVESAINEWVVEPPKRF